MSYIGDPVKVTRGVPEPMPALVPMMPFLPHTQPQTAPAEREPELVPLRRR